MTISEVIDLRVLIDGMWPNTRPLDDSQVQVWQLVLEHTPLDAASTALIRFAREGHQWPPTPGQIANLATGRTRLERDRAAMNRRIDSEMRRRHLSAVPNPQATQSVSDGQTA